MARLMNDNPHPCFVRLYCTFQDEQRLCKWYSLFLAHYWESISLCRFSDFVMTLAKRGELLNHLKRLGSFDDEVTRFYTAEILSALEYLHKLGIVHR